MIEYHRWRIVVKHGMNHCNKFQRFLDFLSFSAQLLPSWDSVSWTEMKSLYIFFDFESRWSGQTVFKGFLPLFALTGLVEAIFSSLQFFSSFYASFFSTFMISDKGWLAGIEVLIKKGRTSTVLLFTFFLMDSGLKHPWSSLVSGILQLQRSSVSIAKI